VTALLTDISDVLVTDVMVTLTVIWIIFTFRMRHSQGKMYSGHGCLCLSVPRRILTLLHGPSCNLGECQGVPSSCALLGGFAVSTWVLLL